MNRSTTEKRGIKHLPFFEVLASEEENSPAVRAATAGLLTLRMIDHWVLAGPVIVEPESVSVRSVRNAIMAMDQKDPARDILLGIVNTMQAVREVDLVPVLPRVFAYGQVLEHRQGAMALAADAYETVARLADEEYEAELLMDSQQRLGFCLRQMGLFDEAERTYEAIERTAKRRRLRSRVLRARIGLAGVTMLRGDLPRADSMCGSIVRESERHQLLAERASALQLQSVVAARREDMGRAVRLAHEALQGSATQSERERILSDLAAYLILERRYDVAIDALRIVELTATTENVRLNAKVNVLIAAARAGYRDLFDRTRRELNEAALAVEARVNMLIESARGIRRFGNPEEAARLLHEAQVLAKAHQLSRSVIEIDRVRAEPMEAGATRESGPSGDPELAALIANDLRERVAALAT